MLDDGMLYDGVLDDGMLDDGMLDDGGAPVDEKDWSWSGMSALANAVPQAIATCEIALRAIDAAVEKAKYSFDTLDIDLLRGLEAVSASTDRTAAAAAVESLMQKTLNALLDEVFSETGVQHIKRLLDEAQKELIDATGESELIGLDHELGLPSVLRLLRSTVEKYADPLLKRLASGVADEICCCYVPAATRLRSLNDPSSMVSDQSDAPEQLLDSPYRKALDTLLDGVSNCLDDPEAVAQQWLLLASEDGNLELVKVLLEKGTLLEEKDVGGRTALMWASAHHARQQQRNAASRRLVMQLGKATVAAAMEIAGPGDNWR